MSLWTSLWLNDLLKRAGASKCAHPQAVAKPPDLVQHSVAARVSRAMLDPPALSQHGEHCGPTAHGHRAGCDAIRVTNSEFDR